MMVAVDERPPKGPALPTSLNVWRCFRCARIIARLFLVPGCTVEIKCASCGAMNTAALAEKPPC
jgi:phage FluMu protein Com